MMSFPCKKELCHSAPKWLTDFIDTSNKNTCDYRFCERSYVGEIVDVIFFPCPCGTVHLIALNFHTACSENFIQNTFCEERRRFCGIEEYVTFNGYKHSEEQILLDFQVFKDECKFTNKKCAACGIREQQRNRMDACDNCKTTFFCSVECYNDHRKKHDKVCKPPTFDQNDWCYCYGLQEWDIYTRVNGGQCCAKGCNKFDVAKNKYAYWHSKTCSSNARHMHIIMTTYCSQTCQFSYRKE